MAATFWLLTGHGAALRAFVRAGVGAGLMIRIFAGALCLAIGSSALAEALRPTLALTPISSPKAAKPDIFDDGWAMFVSRDGFTDNVICQIMRLSDKNILIDKSSIYLNYKERGRIKAYEYRIDSGAPSERRSASAINIEHQAVVFLGEEYSRIMAGKRFRVRSYTSQPYHLDDDYDLRGAKRLLAKLPAFCPQS